MIDYDSRLDREYDIALQQKWEEENAPKATPLDKVDRETVLNAWACMNTTRTMTFEELIQRMNTAAQMIQDTPEYDRIVSMMDQLEDIKAEYIRVENALDENWRGR